MRFVSFWIPCITACDFSPLDLSRMRDIDDLGKHKNTLRLSIDERLDMEVFLNEVPLGQFVCVQKHFCGIITYQIPGDVNLPQIEAVFAKAGYHLYKEFFHAHEFHNHAEDSLVKAYFFDYETCPPPIEPSISNYLGQYRNKFSYYRSQFLDLQCLDQLYRPITLLRKIFSIRKRISSFLGEYNYCQTLMRHASHADKQCQHDIENLKFNFDVRLIEFENIFSQYSFQIQFALAIIGITLTFVGAILAVVPFFHNHNPIIIPAASQLPSAQ